MYRNEQHPDVSLPDWETFREEFPPYLIEQVLNRKDVSIPEWHVPLARGCAIASNLLLQRAGNQPGAHLLRGWREGNGYFVREIDLTKLFITQCHNQDFWTISRSLPELPYSAQRQYSPENISQR